MWKRREDGDKGSRGPTRYHGTSVFGGYAVGRTCATFSTVMNNNVVYIWWSSDLLKWLSRASKDVEGVKSQSER